MQGSEDRYSGRGRESRMCKGPEVGMLELCLKGSRCEDGAILVSVQMALRDNSSQSCLHFQLRCRDHPSRIYKRPGENRHCCPWLISHL